MMKGRKRLVFIAWFLILSLLPVYIVKALHFHCVTEDATTHANASHAHDSDNCSICQFILSPFVEVGQLQINIILPFISFERIFHESRVCNASPGSQSIRAPPKVFCF